MSFLYLPIVYCRMGFKSLYIYSITRIAKISPKCAHWITRTCSKKLFNDITINTNDENYKHVIYTFLFIYKHTTININNYFTILNTGCCKNNYPIDKIDFKYNNVNRIIYINENKESCNGTVTVIPFGNFNMINWMTAIKNII